ncbi:hypothetical protein [uncultured Erythrobacter sp.]|uniref:hypothetical protein n=1 Tax=uncultured Erythrobacter sp. TaxID=263913 RepID=UPI002613673A|nr:hypothetical protein [uncultured Erythrobacter sp.]
MENYANLATRKPVPAHRTRRKPHFFRPVQTRSRADGWCEVRQCLFLAELYLSGTVITAARRVGMSRMSAYRLRARPDAASFARAWDSILAQPGTGKLPPIRMDWRKVTRDELVERFEAGLVKPVLYFGRVVAIERKADNSALLRLIRRFKDQRLQAASNQPQAGRKSFSKTPLARSTSEENAVI